MKIVIAPGKLAGAIPLPSSKSQTHRALLAASLGHGVSTLRGITLSQDIEATLSCLRALGSGVVDRGNALEICGIGGRTRALRTGIPQLDCGESGSTLRFLIPIALALLGGGEFTGRGRLMKRPLEPYFKLFERRGIAYRLEDGILRFQGTLSPGRYELPGNVSSQFITGLLFALPLLAGDSELVLTSPLESRDYVKMTLDILEKYGIQLENRADTGFVIPGGQQFEARDWTVERDWSQGAFWYAANFLGGQVELAGLNSASVQGDKEIATDYRRLSQSGDVELNVSQCPDLVPPLAAMAAVRAGTTHLTHAARLRLKESDRLSSVTRALNAMGARVKEGPDSLIIHGVKQLPGGGTVDCCRDHRIAMMAAVSAAFAQKPVTLLGAECVHKSYPQFWLHFQMLGGKIHGLILR